MASWRIRFHDKWPHLASLYASTHQLDEEGKHPDPMMGQDNVFDPSEPYNAYRYYIQPVARSEFSIEEPTYVNRPVYKDEESRSSGYTSGDSFHRGSTCRVLLCVFLTLSFIGVVVAAITLAILLSKTPRPTSSALTQPDIFESEASLMGRDFNDKLLDKESKEFKDLSAEVCLALEQMFKDYDSPVRNEFSGCEIVEFRNGSIQAIFRLKLTPLTPGGFKDVKKIQQELQSFFAKKVKQTGPWNSAKFNPSFLRRFIRIDPSPVTTTTAMNTTITPKLTTTEKTKPETKESVTEQSPIFTTEVKVPTNSTEDVNTSTLPLTSPQDVTKSIHGLSTDSKRVIEQTTEAIEYTTTSMQSQEVTAAYVKPMQIKYDFDITTAKSIENQTDVSKVDTETTEFPFYYENITDLFMQTETTQKPNTSTVEQSTITVNDKTAHSVDRSLLDRSSTQTIERSTSDETLTTAIYSTSAKYEVFQTTVGSSVQETTNVQKDLLQTTEPFKQKQATTSTLLSLSSGASSISTKTSDSVFELTTQFADNTKLKDEPTYSSTTQSQSSTEAQTTDARQTVLKESMTTQPSILVTSTETQTDQTTVQTPVVTGLADLVAKTTEFPYYNFTDIVPDLNFTGEYWYYETTASQIDTDSQAPNETIPLVTETVFSSTEPSTKLSQPQTDSVIQSTQQITDPPIDEISTVDLSGVNLSLTKTEVFVNDTASNDTFADISSTFNATEKQVSTIGDVTTPLLSTFAHSSDNYTSPQTTTLKESKTTQISQTTASSLEYDPTSSQIIDVKQSTTLLNIMSSNANLNVSSGTTSYLDPSTTNIPPVSVAEDVISTNKPQQEITSQENTIVTDKETSSKTMSSFVTQKPSQETTSSEFFKTTTGDILDGATTDDMSTDSPVTLAIVPHTATDIIIDSYNSSDLDLSTTESVVQTEIQTTQTKVFNKSETTPLTDDTITTVSGLTTPGLKQKSTVADTSFSYDHTSVARIQTETNTFESTSYVKNEITTKAVESIANETSIDTLTNETTHFYNVTPALPIHDSVTTRVDTTNLTEELTSSSGFTKEVLSETTTAGVFTSSAIVGTQNGTDNSTSSITTDSSDTTTETYLYDLVTESYSTTDLNVNGDKVTTVSIDTSTGTPISEKQSTPDITVELQTSASVNSLETTAATLSPMQSLTTTVGPDIADSKTVVPTNLIEYVTSEPETVNETKFVGHDFVDTTESSLNESTSMKTDILNQTLNETSIILNETSAQSIPEHISTEINSIDDLKKTLSTKQGNESDTVVLTNITISNTSEIFVSYVNDSDVFNSVLNETIVHESNETSNYSTTTSPSESVTDGVFQNVTEFYEYYENETYMWYDNSTEFYNTTEQLTVTDSILSRSTETPLILNVTNSVSSSNETTTDVTELPTAQETTLSPEITETTGSTS